MGEPTGPGATGVQDDRCDLDDVAPASPQTSRVGEELLLIGMALERILERRLSRKVGLSLAQVRILALLDVREAQPLEPRQVAEALGLHPATLQHTLEHLIRQRLVLREEHPTDARRRLLTLTSAGHRKTREALPVINGELSAVTEHVSGEARADLITVLESVRRTIARRGAGRPGP